MCAEGRSRDLCLARTVRESAGLRRAWEARLQNRGLQVRFLPGLFAISNLVTSYIVVRLFSLSCLTWAVSGIVSVPPGPSPKARRWGDGVAPLTVTHSAASSME